MTKRRQFDLIVISAEPAGLAAAACAARKGAHVGLIRGDKPPRSASAPGIPDFVWRRLDLQDSGLEVRPVSAKISLFEDGRSFRSYANPKNTGRALEEAGVSDHHLWADFNDNLDRLREEGEALTRCAAMGGGRGGQGALLSALTSPNGAIVADRLTVTTQALLDDFLSDGDLKIHLASTALTPFGLGGDEAGSSLALASLSAPSAWRVRTKTRGPTLQRVLEDAATAAGVEFFDGRIRNLQAPDEKFHALVLDNGETLRATHLMAASVEAAARANVEVSPSLSPLARRDGAFADVRVRFSKTPDAPEGEKDAIFFLADSVASLADARDAALEGRLPERPPLSFEVLKDEIIVHAPYCPAFLSTEGEIRDWTEQDRQAFGRQIVSRLAPFLNGAARSVRRVDVRVLPVAAFQADAMSQGVIAPPPGHDPIGAAATLAMDLIGGE